MRGGNGAPGNSGEGVTNPASESTIDKVADFAGLAARLALPILAALIVVPFVKPNGTLFPWAPSTVDLDVYQYIGHVILDGGDILTARTPTDYLAFIYPPFAALLCIPLVLIPHTLLQALWTASGALIVMVVLRRFGATGWTLSLLTTGCLLLVEPIRETIGFGQVNTILMALVVIDLVPGPRLLPWKRVLPEGVLTGLATTIKVTPALFGIYQLFARRWRVALTVFLTAGVLTVGTALFMWRETWGFASALLGGDTRTGAASFLFNQSTLAAAIRLFGDSGAAHALGLAVGGLAALVGAYAAGVWHRRGYPLFAVSLCGTATLLASPLSWTHHFVWVVPLAAAVWLGRELPFAVRLSAGAFAIWMGAGLYKFMPWENGAEWTYTWFQDVIGVTGPLLGLAVVAIAAIEGRGPIGRTADSIRETSVVR